MFDIQIHDGIGDVVHHIHKPKRLIKFDAIKQEQLIVPKADIAQMQIPMTLPDLEGADPRHKAIFMSLKILVCEGFGFIKLDLGLGSTDIALALGIVFIKSQSHLIHFAKTANVVVALGLGMISRHRLAQAHHYLLGQGSLRQETAE